MYFGPVIENRQLPANLFPSFFSCDARKLSY